MAAEVIHRGRKDLPDPEIYLENKKKTSEDKLKKMIDEALDQIEELGKAEEMKKATPEEQKMRRRRDGQGQ